MRTLFVGDDTGLVKKLRLTVNTTQDVIAEPSKRRQRRKRNVGESGLDEEADDGNDKEEFKVGEDLIDQGIFRDRPEISVKQVEKYGKQEKDEGIQFL